MYLLRVAALVVLLGLLVRFYGVQAFMIVSDSMAPLLVTGDYVLVEKLSYRFREPRRFEVAVLRMSGLGFLTKRLAGFPGETVGIRDGRLWIAGRAVEEEVWAQGAERMLGHWDFGPVRVPAKGEMLSFRGGIAYLGDVAACGCSGIELSFYERLLPPGVLARPGERFRVLEEQYFVLGDNRGNSRDSRFLGFVGGDDVDGRAWLVYWSRTHETVWPRWERMGWVAD